MNKELIGKFLKALREEKNLTQIQLSSAFSGIYSDALISKWERGQSVPNIDDLKTLSKYFNVSVDEILNGTRYEEVDFEKKYFIYNNDWMSRYSSDDLYNVREEQELLIETRFKEILKKMVGDGLSLSEDKEFDFIVNHFYQIFLPAIECKDELALKNSMLCDEICVWVDDIIDSAHDCLPGGLSDIKFEIYKQTALMHNSTIEEKYWEANKKFVFINRQNIWADINNVIEDRENELKDRLNTLENFEKDILLAALQQTNIVNTLATGSPRGKELYEKQYGRKYNEEQLTKQAIKLLIECGAKLNKVFLGYWKVVTWKHSVIDELEHIHKRYKESLLMPVCENGRYHYFIVDNIEKNRAQLGIKYENELFDENDYKELEKRLYAGENIILKPYTWASASGEGDAFIYARKQMLNMSLEAYNESRNSKMTEEILENLDSLSLEAIREKYFPSEYRGEYIDDAQSMSPEELKKKYYIKEESNE